MRFHRMRRGQQVAKFDQRRHGSTPRLGRALEDAIFVLEAQRTHAAYVVNRQEEVEGVQGTALDIRAGASGLLSPLSVVAQDDAARPAIGLGVRDCGVKDGTTTLPAMKSPARYQWNAMVNRQSVFSV